MIDYLPVLCYIIIVNQFFHFCKKNLITRRPKPKLQKVINDSGGIAKTSAFLAAGLYKSDIGKLVPDDILERICHRFYQLTGNLDIV